MTGAATTRGLAPRQPLSLLGGLTPRSPRRVGSAPARLFTARAAPDSPIRCERGARLVGPAWSAHDLTSRREVFRADQNGLRTADRQAVSSSGPAVRDAMRAVDACTPQEPAQN